MARRIDRLDALKADLLRQHPSVNVYSYSIDLSDDAAIDAFLRWLWNEGLRVNFLINNAGLGDRGEFQSGDWNKIKMMLDVNISALTKLTHRLLPMLRSFGDAAIFNVSSSAQLFAGAALRGVCGDEGLRDEFFRGDSAQNCAAPAFP